MRKRIATQLNLILHGTRDALTCLALLIMGEGFGEKREEMEASFNFEWV